MSIQEFQGFRKKKKLTESLRYFIEVVHKEVNGVDFVFKGFHNLIISTLEDIVLGRNVKRNLALCLAVGAGKSLITQYFITWTFCRNKNMSYLYTSHSRENISKFSREIKQILEIDFIKRIFDLKIRQDEGSKSVWSIEGSINRTGMRATTIDSGLNEMKTKIFLPDRLKPLSSKFSNFPLLTVETACMIC